MRAHDMHAEIQPRDLSYRTIKHDLEQYFADNSYYEVEDHGIGTYEFHGQVGHHSHKVPYWIGPEIFEVHNAEKMLGDKAWDEMPCVFAAGPAGTEWQLFPDWVNDRPCYVLNLR